MEFIIGKKKLLTEIERLKSENTSLYERMAKLSEELEGRIASATLDLKKRYNQLEILGKITADVSLDIELDSILSSVIKGVQYGLGFDRVGIFEIDEKNAVIRGRLGVDRFGNPENIENETYSLDENDNNFAKIASGKIEYFFTENAEDTLPESQKKYIVSGLKQNAVVPMKAHGKVIGMIAVDNLITKKPITSDDLNLLKTFALSAASAVHNAKMYGKEREALAHLKKLEEIKNSFLSRISHEFRTPLASIKDSIFLLLNRITGEITPKQEKFLNIAVSNADRLSALIEEFLDASKMEFAGIDLEISLLNIAKVVDEALLALHPQIEKKHIAVSQDISKLLPPVHADKNKIYRVMINLIGNAVKFTPEDGKIFISSHEDGDLILISVEDTGIGIDKSNIENIFEKFYQIENKNIKSPPGIGLGLTIAKEIVEAHGGKIRAESAGLEQGARFSFTIPKG